MLKAAVVALMTLALPGVAASYTYYSPTCPGSSLKGYKWNSSTPDLPVDVQRQAVIAAFRTWESVTNVTFTSNLTGITAANTIAIGWAYGDHGDGSSYAFDGPAGVAAHAFNACFGSFAGDMHFDEAESWSDQPQSPFSGLTDLTTVALHEVGHTLGLAHSTYTGAVMYPSPSGSVRLLGWDDIIGVQGLHPRSNGVFHLRYVFTDGPPQKSFLFQKLGDRPVAGDWDGDGQETVGTYRDSNGQFTLAHGNPGTGDDLVFYGRTGDLPVVGDWNGDGVDTVGIYRPSDNHFYLDDNNGGSSEYYFGFGLAGDFPVAGDWNGDGKDTVGLYRPSTGTFHLKNTNAAGPADLAPTLGTGGDLPVVGDWDGNGTDTIGVYRPGTGTIWLRHSNTTGPAQTVISYGAAQGHVISNPAPVAGDWDNNTTDTVGLFQR